MRNVRSLSLCVLLAALSVSAANRTLQTPTVFTVPGAADLQTVFARDFTGDGKADVLAAEYGKLHLLAGLGNGLFGAPTTTDVTGLVLEGMAELNGDGNPDLYFLTPQGTIAVMLGLGDGSFSAPSQVPTPAPSAELVASDFDGDGKIDLAALSPSQRKIVVLPGDGNGGFGAASTTAFTFNYSQELSDATAGDFDGDGKNDIVAVSSDYVRSIAWNTGTSFTEGSLPFPNAGNSAAAADLDGDGLTDLIVAGSDVTYVTFGTASRTLTSTTLPAVTSSDNGIAVVDLDSDGRSEVVLVGVAGLQIVSRDASGFRPIRAAALDFDGTGVAAADFDGDGNTDFVSVSGGELTLLRSDADGELLSHPVFALRAMSDATMGVHDVFIGDVNGDADADILALASGYFVQKRAVVFFGSPGESFSPPVSTTIPQLQSPIVRDGDLNDDGRTDLVLWTRDSDEVSLVTTLLSRPDGTFQVISDSQTGMGAPFTVRDFDGDGKDDILTWQGELLAGTGDGKFAAPATTGMVLSAYNTLPFGYVAVANLNGDSLPDVLLRQGSVLHSYLNQGGTFSDAATTPFANSIYGVADLDGDGRDDMISTRAYLNDGSGAFTRGSLKLDATSTAWPVDADGDGRMDIATSRAIYFSSSSAGSFDMVAQTAFGGRADAGQIISTADYDHNGSPDLWIWRGGVLTVVPTRKGDRGSAAAQVTVTTTPNPSPYPNLYATNVSVSGIGVNVRPRGSVLITHGSDLPSALLRLDGNGFASEFHATFPVGTTSTITADFLGDEFYAASSGADNHSVKRGIPSTTLNASRASLPYGQVSHITAGLGSYTGEVPTGTVTFLNNGTAFATMPAASSMRTDTSDVSIFPIGTHSVTFSYPGDSRFEPTVSAPLKIVVTKIPVDISLTLSSVSPTTQDQVTLSATVNHLDLTAPITFTCFGRVLGSAPIVNQKATLVTNLPWGAGACYASYPEQASYAYSVSLHRNVVVYYASMPAAPLVVASRGQYWGDVALSISPIAGASEYDIYRSIDGGPMVLWSTVYIPSSNANFPENATVAVYAVLARNSSGQTTPMGPPDLVTMMDFTDDPLVPLAMRIRSTHVSELQNAINAVRVASGLAPATFAPPTGIIAASHLTSLRTAITQARAALGLPTTFTDPTISPGVTKVRAVHWQELRDAMK